jgi:hypothetical protein
VGKARAIRRLGSAAIDLCWVAAGRMDGFWEENLQPWDTRAGALLVQEAGGRVTGLDGATWDPYARHLLACTRPCSRWSACIAIVASTGRSDRPRRDSPPASAENQRKNRVRGAGIARA